MSGFLVYPPSTNSTVFNPNFYSSSSDAQYLKLSGGVVRGLSTFDSGLTVNGSFTLNGSVADLTTISGITAGSAAASKALVLDTNKTAYGLSSLEFTNTGTGTSCIVLRQSPATCASRFYNSPTTGLIGTLSAHPFVIQTNNIGRLYIDSSGNMGNITTPGYSLEIRGCIRSEGILASTSTSTGAADIGQIWAYDANMTAGTSSQHICFGRTRTNADLSHYHIRTVYNANADYDNNCMIWAPTGSTQGLSMNQRGNIRVTGRNGGSAQATLNAALDVLGYETVNVPGGYSYNYSGSSAIGGGTVNVSLRTSNDIHSRGTLYATSDARFKTNIVDLEQEEILKVLELCPVHFHWKGKKLEDGSHEDHPTASRQSGFIAQQVASHLPDLVGVVPNEETDDGFQLVLAEQKIIPYLVGICKLQQARLEELEATVMKLISRPVVSKWLQKEKTQSLRTGI